MPNPPKPIEQKRRAGTLRKDRTPQVGNLAAVPAIALDAHELTPLEAFERVLASGVHWIGQSDSPVVSMVREALEERADLRAAVMLGHGKRTDLRELDKHVVSLLSQLGFNPTARSRLGLAEVKAVSTMERLKAERGK